MKLKKIIDAVPALQKLANADMSLKRLYWVKKLITQLESEVKFFNEEREKIIKKHCENGKVKPDHVDEYKKDFEELLALEVNVNYKEVEIPDTEDIKLSVNDLEALNGFVKVLFEDEGNDNS